MTIVKDNPSDEFVIVCSDASTLCLAEQYGNVKVVRVPIINSVEYRRLHLLIRELPNLVGNIVPTWSGHLTWGPTCAPEHRTSSVL